MVIIEINKSGSSGVAFDFLLIHTIFMVRMNLKPSTLITDWIPFNRLFGMSGGGLQTAMSIRSYVEHDIERLIQYLSYLWVKSYDLPKAPCIGYIKKVGKS